jgi:hypothetical protein
VVLDVLAPPVLPAPPLALDDVEVRGEVLDEPPGEVLDVVGAVDDGGGAAAASRSCAKEGSVKPSALSALTESVSLWLALIAAVRLRS